MNGMKCDMRQEELNEDAGRRSKKSRAKSSEIGRNIIEYLERNPATPKELSDDLGINRNTVKSNLRGRLMNLGLLRQLDSGKYVARWISDEEIRVRAAYSNLDGKLKRRPSPEEIAICIKEPPQKSRELLLKYIPRYAEPKEEEIHSYSKVLAKIIAYGGLEFSSKKTLYGKGIEHIVVEGLDQETLNEILTGVPEGKLEEARTYLKKFPEMRAKLTHEDRGAIRHYKVKWSYDAVNYLHIYCPKDQIAEASIPRRPRGNLSRYQELRSLVNGEKRRYAIGRIEELAENCVPAPIVIEDLLNWLRSSDKKEDILIILKMFCKNGLEVDQINEGQRVQLCSALSEIAFETSQINENDYPLEYAERWISFEILKMLDRKRDKVGEKAKEFVYAALWKGYSTGNYLFAVGKWLAGNPDFRTELMKRVEDILINSDDKNIVAGSAEFLKKIDSGWNHKLNSDSGKDLGYLLETPVQGENGIFRSLRNADR
jgi:DNA-binding CsgD family transcriptional regulator